jgi:lipopolysaccharide/colanic/teichoic acid biosynthesis glycosyltransferase
MLPMRTTFYTRHGKRWLDVLAAACALLVLAPVLVLLALLVRIFLGAPVLFRQERTGLGRRRFTILKFRTMTDEPDAQGILLPDSQRLTRFGRWLRRSSLDELPELWNVIKGEMSLVGPRPLLPRYDAHYSKREALRFAVLPGITGWAQINGRNDLPWDDRLECDAWYVESCSFVLDLKILCRTVVKVLRRENIQADPGQTFGALDEERRRPSGGRGQPLPALHGCAAAVGATVSLVPAAPAPTGHWRMK